MDSGHNEERGDTRWGFLQEGREGGRGIHHGDAETRRRGMATHRCPADNIRSPLCWEGTELRWMRGRDRDITTHLSALTVSRRNPNRARNHNLFALSLSGKSGHLLRVLPEQRDLRFSARGREDLRRTFLLPISTLCLRGAHYPLPSLPRRSHAKTGPSCKISQIFCRGGFTPPTAQQMR